MEDNSGNCYNNITRFCVARNFKKESMRAQGISILRGLISRTDNTFLYVETGTERQIKGVMEATEKVQWGYFLPISLLHFLIVNFCAPHIPWISAASFPLHEQLILLLAAKTGTKCNYYLVPLGSYLYLPAGPWVCLREAPLLSSSGWCGSL